MSNERPWPLIQGIPRVWPSHRSIGPPKQGESVYRMQCHYCLGLFSTNDRRRRYCSAECRNAMHNAVRRKSRLDTIECPICHRRFTPRRHNQRWCSSQCRKLAHYRRRHGQPADRLSHMHTDSEKEQRRAQGLRNRRYQREEEQERNSPKPYQNHVGILDPNRPLGADLVRRIKEILADQTDSESD